MLDEGDEPPLLEATPFGLEKGDQVNALAASDRVVAVGTTSGDLLLFDVSGNELRRAAARHSGAVGAVALTPDSEFVASVGLQDGKVVVDGIALNSRVSFTHTPGGAEGLMAVALDPEFGVRGERLVFGGFAAKLVLYSRSWLGGNETVLDDSKLAIKSLAWVNGHIFSVSPGSIRVFSARNEQFLSQFTLQSPEAVPRMAFLPNQNRILITLPETVELFEFNESRSVEFTSVPDLQESTEFSQSWTDASPFGCDGFMTLSPGLEPAKSMVTLFGRDTTKLASLSIQADSRKEAGLVHLTDGDPLVLVYSRIEDDDNAPGVIAVRRFPQAKKVDWLLTREKYEDAVLAAKDTPRGQLRELNLSVSRIWEHWLQNLLRQQEFDTLGGLLDSAVHAIVIDTHHNLEKRKEAARNLWETWITTLMDKSHFIIAADALPLVIGPYPPDIPALYDRVIEQLVFRRPNCLSRILQKWNSEVFTVAAVTNHVESELRKKRRSSGDASVAVDQLREVLVLLYSSQSRFHETLQILIDEKNPEVFKLIRTHSLYQVLHERSSLEALFSIDMNQTASLLAASPEQLVSPQSVMAALKGSEHPEWIYMYLWRVFKQSPSRITDFHQDLVGLVAQFGSSDDLMTLLTKSTDYKLEEALSELESRMASSAPCSFGRERAYILSRMGDLPGALSILLKETEDFASAIDLASHSTDTELWEILLDHAEERPQLLSALLDRPRGGPDPMAVVGIINDDMVIDGLNAKLQRVLKELSLDRALQEGCASIIEHSTEQSAIYHENLMRSSWQP